MNKSAIKNFAIWARNKLISDIQFRARLIGVLPDGIREPLPQSDSQTQFFDIGTKDYVTVKGDDVSRRAAFVEALQAKAARTDYATAYKSIIEKVAYTWFNRLIAIRFMEVNDYLPGRVRVLSSRMAGKAEPDIVTEPFDAGLDFTPEAQDAIQRFKDENRLDELFRMLFIAQCQSLSGILPGLFAEKEKAVQPNDYFELLLTINFTDRDGLVWRLVNDIPEKDFRVRTEADNLRQIAENIPEEEMPAGQVEIIGWLYQYYNTEPKNDVFAGLKKNKKISADDIPAATQLFTPDWIVRYMVQNSLGRLWSEGHPEACARFMPEHNEDGSVRVKEGKWNYYLEEAKQEPQVEAQLAAIREEYARLQPQDIKVIDPCCGSGHIAVYLFDVLMQIYESAGWSRRDAAQSIVENNLYALDIDDRAAQLAYFAVMMKAREYDRRFFTHPIQPRVHAIPEWDGEIRQSWSEELRNLCNLLRDGKEYGSIIDMPQMNWSALRMEVERMADMEGQLSFDSVSEETRRKLCGLIDVGQVMAQKYNVVVTNPPYMGSSGMGEKLSKSLKECYPDSKSDLFAVFIERCRDMTKSNGYQAMITQHAWMFLSSFEKLRGKLLQIDIINMAHLGARAFEEIGGEVVQTVSFVVRNSTTKGIMSYYLKLIDKQSQSAKESAFLNHEHIYSGSTSLFYSIPYQMFLYWLKEEQVQLFDEGKLERYVEIKQGVATSDNNRFLRIWFEVVSSKIGFGMDKMTATHSTKKWFPYNKGGTPIRWYGNQDYVVNYENDGKEMKAFHEVLNREHPGGRLKNPEYYFREGFTWSTLSNTFAVRYCPQGFIFDTKGSMGFVNDGYSLGYFLALLNSTVGGYWMNTLAPTLDFNPIALRQVPVKFCYTDRWKLFIDDCISLARADWDSFETSWDFQCHPLIDVISRGGPFFERGCIDLAECWLLWKGECEERFQQLKANEEELNRIFIDIYGLQDELTPEVADKDVTVRRADLSRDIRSLISYAVGCMFGRYALGVPGLVYAGGKWEDVYGTLEAPWETGAGDVMTTASGDTLTIRIKNGTVKRDGNEIGLMFFPDDDNCLPITDEDYGLKDDIVNRLVEFIRVVYGDATLETNLDFIAHALGNRGDTSRDVIRNYFLNDFFKDHCSTYSVTGSGKRPIYWLFDSGKQNGFKALVYMHRWNADTVGNLRVEYLHRMQRVYEKEIERMQNTIENSRDSREIARATKRREKLVKQLKETRDYDAKIAHVALSRVEIDLDDGVKVNYEKVQKGPDGKTLGILAKI